MVYIDLCVAWLNMLKNWKIHVFWIFISQFLINSSFFCLFALHWNLSNETFWLYGAFEFYSHFSQKEIFYFIGFNFLYCCYTYKSQNRWETVNYALFGFMHHQADCLISNKYSNSESEFSLFVSVKTNLETVKK